MLTVVVLGGMVLMARGAVRTVIVDFGHPTLDDAFLASLDEAMGYECREFTGVGQMMLLVDAERELALQQAFAATLLEAPKVDRCSTRLADYGDRGEFEDARILERAHLETIGVESLQTMTPLSTPTRATLRLIMHAGAAADVGHTLAEWRALVEVAVAANCSACAVRHHTDDLSYVDHVPKAQLESLAMALLDQVACVCYVEPVFREQMVNLWTSSTAQVPNAMSATDFSAADTCSDAVCRPLWADGLRGQGQLLAISDTGVATSACHFYDAVNAVPSSSSSTVPADTGHRKIRAYWSFQDGTDQNGHGTHTAGTAVGRSTDATRAAGFDAADFDGAAPDARLVVIDAASGSSGGLVLPSPYDTALLAYGLAAGAKVHSGSWGVADWAYSDEDRRVDLFSWQNRHFLGVFAAGNSGERGASSILSPALAKNVLAVGAAMNGFVANDIASGQVPSEPADAYAYDWVADFSSRGGPSVPWLKPDVLGGGGRFVWSASSSSPSSCAVGASTVVGLSGTSMATPQVAGAALLVRQYFMSARYYSTPFEPTGSMLRALLAASATPTRGVFPLVSMSTLTASGAYAPYGRRSIEGHGRVSVASALPVANATAVVVLSNEGRAFTAAGQVHRYCIDINPAGVAGVEVGMAFTDYPSPLTAGTKQLVNDLDLRVYTDGTPNALLPNGLSVADRRSTIEVVQTLTLSGEVRVEVESHQIGFSQQDYSLIVVIHKSDVGVTVNGAPLGDPAALPQRTGSTECLAVETTTTVPPTTAATTTAATTTAATTTVPTSAPPTIAPPAPTGVCRLSPTSALVQLGALGDVVLCCRTYDQIALAFFERSQAADPVFERLLRHMVTYDVNVERGVDYAPLEQMAAAIARAFIQTHCAGSESQHVRAQVHAQWRAVRALNEHTCGAAPPAPPPAGCVDEQADADALYCQSAGDYVFATNRCQCDQERHQNDGHCAEMHCSTHGASVTEVGGVERCACFLGWMGDQCSACAASPTENFAYLCVGVDRRRRRAAHASHTHVLELVAESGVAARLAGTYYEDSQHKAADARPGTSSLDCWCATAQTQTRATDYDTHADAAAAALSFLDAREALRATAMPRERRAQGVEPTLAPAPVPGPSPPANGGAKTAPNFSLAAVAAIFAHRHRL